MVKADNPVDEWNTFHIVICGDCLTVTLHDKPVIDDAPLPGVPRLELIALQLHSERKDGEWAPRWCSFSTSESKN